MPAPGSASATLHPWLRIGVVAGLTVLALCFRLHQIGRESLWMDEGTSVAAAALDWGELFRVLLFERANMAFYLVLLKVWMPLTEGEAGVRLLSALFAAASIPAIERLGRRLVSPAVGLTAAFFLTFHGFHVRYSQEARSYTLLVLLVIVTSHLFVDWVEKGSRRTLAAYVALATIAVYSQFLAFFIVGSHVVSLAFGTTREEKRRGAMAGGAVLLLVAPLLAVMAFIDLPRTAWIPPLTMERFLWLLVTLAGAGERMAWLAAVLAVIAIGMAVWAKGSNNLRRLAVWAFLPLLVSAIVSIVHPMIVARYLLVVLAPILLLLACGAMAVPTRIGKLATASLFVWALLPGIGEAWNERKDEWRLASEVVIANARPGDAMYFVVHSGYRAFNFYAEDAVRPQPRSLHPHPDYMWAMQPAPNHPEELMKRYPRVWVFTTEAEIGRGRRFADLAAGLKWRHHRVRRWTFHGVGVELWEKTAGEGAS